MVHSDRQYCRACLEKQREIDQLRSENVQLKANRRVGVAGLDIGDIFTLAARPLSHGVQRREMP